MNSSKTIAAHYERAQEILGSDLVTFEMLKELQGEALWSDKDRAYFLSTPPPEGLLENYKRFEKGTMIVYPGFITLHDRFCRRPCWHLAPRDRQSNPKGFAYLSGRRTPFPTRRTAHPTFLETLV